MESWVVVFLVTIGYLFLSLMVGVLSGRRASSSTEGYVAGDRNLGFLVLYFVLGASIFSAFAFLGGPGFAYSRGAAAFYILSYGTFGLTPWYFFGPRVARLGRRFGYVTQAELFAHRFESKSLSAALAVISLIAFVPYLNLQIKGAGYVFNIVTEGRIPIWMGAAIAYGVVLIYVFKSGVLGVAWTNTFQGILMMALAWGLGLYLPYKLYGGVGAMFDQLADTTPAMLEPPGLVGGEPWSWGAYTSAILISAIGFSMWPHYFMKIYTAKSIRTLKLSIVFYPTFQIFLIPILFIGFSGILKFSDVAPADTILPTILIVARSAGGAHRALLRRRPGRLHVDRGRSPARGPARWSSRTSTGFLFRPDMSDHAQAVALRAMVVVLSAFAYYIAVATDVSLVLMLLLSYGFISQIFPVIVATFLWPRATSPGSPLGRGGRLPGGRRLEPGAVATVAGHPPGHLGPGRERRRDGRGVAGDPADGPGPRRAVRRRLGTQGRAGLRRPSARSALRPSLPTTPAACRARSRARASLIARASSSSLISMCSRLVWARNSSPGPTPTGAMPTSAKWPPSVANFHTPGACSRPVTRARISPPARTPGWSSARA